MAGDTSKPRVLAVFKFRMIEPRCLLDRQIGWFPPLENLINERPRTAPDLRKVDAIGR
jgi:hypothetical protein